MTPTLNGYPVKVEAFYETALTRDYGDGLFGDDVFGDDPGVGLYEWQAVPCDRVVSIEYARGDEYGSRVVPVDQLLIVLDDPDLAVYPFRSGVALRHPDVGDPIRVTIADVPVVTARLERVTVNYTAGRRLVTLEAFGMATDGAQQMTWPARSSEQASTRIGALIGDVYPDRPDLTAAGLDPVTIEPGTTFATCDPLDALTNAEPVTVLDELAATIHASYDTDRYGRHRFQPYPLPSVFTDPDPLPDLVGPVAEPATAPHGPPPPIPTPGAAPVPATTVSDLFPRDRVTYMTQTSNPVAGSQGFVRTLGGSYRMSLTDRDGVDPRTRLNVGDYVVSIPVRQAASTKYGTITDLTTGDYLTATVPGFDTLGANRLIVIYPFDDPADAPAIYTPGVSLTTDTGYVFAGSSTGHSQYAYTINPKSLDGIDRTGEYGTDVAIAVVVFGEYINTVTADVYTGTATFTPINTLVTGMDVAWDGAAPSLDTGYPWVIFFNPVPAMSVTFTAGAGTVTAPGHGLTPGDWVQVTSPDEWLTGPHVGHWLDGSNYTAGVFVSWNGSTYECIADHAAATITEPGVGSIWTSAWVERPAPVSDVYTVVSVPDADTFTVDKAGVGDGTYGVTAVSPIAAPSTYLTVRGGVGTVTDPAHGAVTTQDVRLTGDGVDSVWEIGTVIDADTYRVGEQGTGSYVAVFDRTIPVTATYSTIPVQVTFTAYQGVVSSAAPHGLNVGDWVWVTSVAAVTNLYTVTDVIDAYSYRIVYPPGVVGDTVWVPDGTYDVAVTPTAAPPALVEVVDGVTSVHETAHGRAPGDWVHLAGSGVSATTALDGTYRIESVTGPDVYVLDGYRPELSNLRRGVTVSQGVPTLPDPLPYWFVFDCDDPAWSDQASGQGWEYVELEYVADTANLLTVARTELADGTVRETVNTPGVARHGRLTNARGFPAVIHTSDASQIDAWHTAVLDRAAATWRRPHRMRLDTRTAPVFAERLAEIDRGLNIRVFRTRVRPTDYRCIVTGWRAVLRAVRPGDLIAELDLFLETVEVSV